MEMTKKKHLSSIANDLLHRCSLRLDTSESTLVQEFESNWRPESGGYSKKLVEYCSSKALNVVCSNIEEAIRDGSFSRLTFDMMVAWEMPSSTEEESHMECLAKEKEEKKGSKTLISEQDDIPLFYSDIMPLLVDREASVGEDAYVWLGSLVPLVADVVNGRFTFETLTSTTANRLHFPAYDIFVKEMDKSIKQLQKQATPKGVEMADDEFILHVEGTAGTQRVIRHIGGTSWPGRLTLTNYALYFEASGAISYEDAIKLDLSKNVEHSIKPAATGPFGAPLFDKAIIYESSELQEGVVLEFPELTSSTRRDHWLALTKEIMLLHEFLLKFKIVSPIQAWELHARTILGIIRLHAARDMLRISPPDPKSFLIFALFDELPKGDYVLEELAESLKNVKSGHPCSASSILRGINVSQPCVNPCVEGKEGIQLIDTIGIQADNLTDLETTIEKVREEAKQINIAKATAEELKEEGIGDTVLVLMVKQDGLFGTEREYLSLPLVCHVVPMPNLTAQELLKPAQKVMPHFERVLSWERPVTTIIVILSTLVVVYKEWVGMAVAVFLLWLAAKMIQAKKYGTGKQTKIVVCTASDQTTMESIVSAQHGLNTIHNMMQMANISILKIWSIFLARAPKHTDMAIMALTALAVILAVIPLKFIILPLVLSCFMTTSKFGKQLKNENRNRRLKEWWDSIPVIPVEVTDKIPNSPFKAS